MQTPHDPGQGLGQRVRSLRAASGLSQKELARRARVTQPRISQIESGQNPRPLTLRLLTDLADALGVDVDAIVAGDPAYEFIDQNNVRPSQPPQVASLQSSVELVGRAADLAALVGLVRGGTRLLTLVGPGGVGKTQLAIHACHELTPDFPERMAFVSLAACLDPGCVISTIARAVGLRERDARPLRNRLLSDLPSKPFLLILDNVEQAIVPIAGLTAELLESYSDLTLLLTSRTPLHIRMERQYRVLPLGLPDPAQTISVATAAASPAVALFVQRAGDVDINLSLTEQNAAQLAAICRRLDGLPLAIELAAARMRLFSPGHLLQQLDRRLTFLTGSGRDLPLRQKSLRASIGWSFDLLDADQQILFRRLAVFAGGFTLEAATSVVADPLPDELGEDRPALGFQSESAEIDEGIMALLDQHLLIRTERADGVPRFAMLETIHDFALEQLLASGEASELRLRHLQWMTRLAERADSALFGFEQEPWLQQLDAEWENSQVALSWTMETGNAGAALRLAAALTDYWYLRGSLSEGGQWLDRALALKLEAPMQTGLARARVRALAAASQISLPRGDYAGAGTRADLALTLARAIGDRQGEARALALLANHALVQEDLELAESMHRAALARFRELGGNHRWVVAGLNNLSQIAYQQDDNEEALALASEALTFATQSGDAWGLAMAHQRLGDAALALEQIVRAANHFIFSLTQNRRQGLQWGVANAVAASASLATATSMPDQAVRLFASAAALYQSLGVMIPPRLRPDWVKMLEGAREDLSDEQFAPAWRAGSRLSSKEAVTEALAIAMHAGRPDSVPQ